VEVSVCECRTVGGNQKVGVVKVRGVHRHQLDLNRPLAQRTLVIFSLVFKDCLFVIVRRFPVFKGDRTGRTHWKAVAEAVAVIIPNQFCFSVDHLNGSFMTGRSAETASIALFLIYFYYLSYHSYFLLEFVIPSYYNEHKLSVDKSTHL